MRSTCSSKFYQRCAVRVTYSTNKTTGQWKTHGHYIARESVARKEDFKAVGFSVSESAVNVPERLAAWQAAGDERMFKIIVSPEFCERMDLERHTRDLVKRIDRSLGTKLEWVGVIHHNTEHLHVHIGLRGIDEHGASLRSSRAFIQHGIRRHAEELATRQLGFRTELDALEAQRREVQQLRFTGLDRIIRSRLSNDDGGHFIIRREAIGLNRRFARAQEHHVQARLGKLEEIGLAAKTAPHTWLVRRDFDDILRTMRRANDRQKMLARHAALVSDARLPLQITPPSGIFVLEGRVLGHGHEESADRPYLLLEGVEGKIHLLWQTAEIEAARRYGELKVNSFVRLEKHFAGSTFPECPRFWKLLEAAPERYLFPICSDAPTANRSTEVLGWMAGRVPKETLYSDNRDARSRAPISAREVDWTLTGK